MNPSHPPDPLGCRQSLLHAKANPDLWSDQAVNVDRAACDLAIALGRCRLFGVPLDQEDGTLLPELAIAAAVELVRRLEMARDRAERLEEIAAASPAEDVFEHECTGLLQMRMDAWGAFLAIDEPYQDALLEEQTKEQTRQLSATIDQVLDALTCFDHALQKQAEILAVTAETALLDNWRDFLATEFAQVLPWWLDGTLEHLAKQAEQALKRQLDSWQQSAHSTRTKASPSTLAKMNKPSWLPGYLASMAAAGKSPPVPMPGNKLCWDDPETGCVAEMVLPTQFSGPAHMVTLLFRNASGTLAKELSGPVEFAGITGNIEQGIARFTAEQLQGCTPTPRLLVGQHRTQWKPRDH